MCIYLLKATFKSCFEEVLTNHLTLALTYYWSCICHCILKTCIIGHRKYGLYFTCYVDNTYKLSTIIVPSLNEKFRVHTKGSFLLFKNVFICTQAVVPVDSALHDSWYALRVRNCFLMLSFSICNILQIFGITVH